MKTITAKMAQRLLERGLELPVNGVYADPVLKNIVLTRKSLTERIMFWDNEVARLASLEDSPEN